MGFFRDAMQESVARGETLSPQDRTHAAAAHVLGAVVGMFTAGLFLPIVATTLVLIFNTSRHRFVLFHVNQAAWFQLLVSVAASIFGVVFVVVYFMTCGLGVLLLPLALVPWAFSVLAPLWVALGAYQGRWALYPYLGDWVLDEKQPFIDS